MARSTLLVLTSVVLSAAAAGCGGASYDHPAPPPEARAAVIRYLDALAQGRTGVACRQLTPDARTALRDNALGAFRVKPGSEASRRKQVQAAHARAATCDGAMRLLAEETRASLPPATARARKLPMSWIGPRESGEVSLGDQEWVVERRDGAWRIAADNALPAEG